MSDVMFEVVFIGAGPGGYVGAVRAGQLGLKTAIIEKDPTLGGTCLNVGCIPSKALLESSELFHASQKEYEAHGVKISGVTLDLPTMLKRKDEIVKGLTGGVAFLMKKNKVEVYKGLGTIKDPNTIEVKSADGKSTTVKTKNIVLATGSVPNALPGLKIDGKFVITSTEALALPEVPKHMIVIGAGAIGLEMGSVWSRLGSKVTVIEFANKICGPTDNEISTKMLQIMKKQGLEFILEAAVQSAEVKGKSVLVTYKDRNSNKTETLSADVVLVAAGRKPFADGVGLEALGIERDKRGFVLVNDHWQTKHENIFAIGDLIPGPMLAHKAEEEGVAVAELIAGHAGHVNYDTVPNIIYTWPEVAAVGKTEEELKAEGIPYRVGKFPFLPNGRAKAMGQTDGLAKVLAHAETDRLLGVHIVGPRASELISEAVVAMEFAGSSEDLARSFHAHPTLSEIVREAALAVDQRARQM